jgi:hypothetical protein
MINIIYNLASTSSCNLFKMNSSHIYPLEAGLLRREQERMIAFLMVMSIIKSSHIIN